MVSVSWERQADELPLTAIVSTSSEGPSHEESGSYQNVTFSGTGKLRPVMIPGQRCGVHTSLKSAWVIVGYVLGFSLVASLCIRFRRRAAGGGVERRRLAEAWSRRDEASELADICEKIGHWSPNPAQSSVDPNRLSPMIVESYFKELLNAQSGTASAAEDFGSSSHGSMGKREMPFVVAESEAVEGCANVAELVTPTSGDSAQAHLLGDLRGDSKLEDEDFSEKHQGGERTSVAVQVKPKVKKFHKRRRKSRRRRLSARIAAEARRDPDCKRVFRDRLRLKRESIVENSSSSSLEETESDSSSLERETLTRRHPFLRLPVVKPGVSVPLLCVEAIDKKDDLVRLVLAHLKEVRVLLLLPELGELEASHLIKRAEKLASHAKHCFTESISHSNINTSIKELGRRFMVLDALYSISQVLGDSMQMALWWQQVVNGVSSDFDGNRFGDKVSRGSIRLAENLRDTIDMYKAGEHPSLKRSKRIKTALFSGAMGTSEFTRGGWDPWQRDAKWTPKEVY